MADIIQRPDSTYPIIIKPYKLDVSQFGDKVRDQMKFTITNVSDKEVELGLVAGIPKYAQINLPQKIGAGQSGSGTIKLLPNVLDQTFEKSFTLEVKGEKGIRFTVPVKRTVKSTTTESTGATEKPAEGGH
jgi:hypothetical protein